MATTMTKTTTRLNDESRLVEAAGRLERRQLGAHVQQVGLATLSDEAHDIVEQGRAVGRLGIGELEQRRDRDADRAVERLVPAVDRVAKLERCLSGTTPGRTRERERECAADQRGGRAA